MASSHLIPSHRLRSGTVLRSVVGAAFLAATGLSFLCLKHGLHVAGARKRALETELHDLSVRGRVLDNQIAELTSRTALQGRLKDGFIHMVEIPGAAVVHVRLLPESPAGGLASAGLGDEAVSEAAANRGLRPVSHDAAGRSGLRTARQ